MFFHSMVYRQRYIIVLLGMLSGVLQANILLPEVLVSATRSDQPGIQIPATHYVIDRDQIVQSAARSLAELLDQQPGVHVADSGVAVRIDMRGFGNAASSNVAILLNGRKLNPSTDAATLYLNSIDLDQVQQIEIISGSAGTLYGNQAVGGMINIITQQPYAGRETQARVGFGSYQSQELMLHHLERLENGLGMHLAARQHQNDNYRQHNASDLKQLLAELDMQHARGQTTLSLRYLDEYTDTPGALLAAEMQQDRRQVAADYVNDYLDTRSYTLTLDTEQALNAVWKLAAELTYQDDTRDFLQSFRGFAGAPATQDRTTWSLNSRLLGQYQSMHYTIGADLQYTDYLLNTSFGPQGNQQRLLAWYGQAQFALSQPMTATLGLRHARIHNNIQNNSTATDLDDALTVGSAGLEYAWSEQIETYLRADQNYRFAKVDEHTNVIFGQPTGLDNQRSVSYETGVRVTTPRYRMQAQAYRLNLQNEISFDANTFANINLARSRRVGALISTEWTLHPQWDMGASWEYIDSKITAGPHQGNRVPLVPQNRGTGYVQYQPTPDWRIRADLERVGEQVLGGDYHNTGNRLAHYTVLNLITHYDTDHWRFSARINNLFNEKYAETGAASFAGEGYHPAPERNAWLTVSYFFDE